MLTLDRRLDSLAISFRPRAYELLARLIEARIMVMIVNTRRTPEQQAELVRAGRSWTSHSAHEDGCAIDLCPYAVYQLHGPDKALWDETEPVWQKMGEIGRKIGLKWGIVMHGQHFDLGHFALPT